MLELPFLDQPPKRHLTDIHFLPTQRGMSNQANQKIFYCRIYASRQDRGKLPEKIWRRLVEAVLLTLRPNVRDVCVGPYSIYTEFLNFFQLTKLGSHLSTRVRSTLLFFPLKVTNAISLTQKT